MSILVDVHEAKTHFSKLLGRVALGEEIVIAKVGEPVARLVPLTQERARTPAGQKVFMCPTPSLSRYPKISSERLSSAATSQHAYVFAVDSERFTCV